MNAFDIFLRTFAATFGAWFGAAFAIVLSLLITGVCILRVLADLDPERIEARKTRDAARARDRQAKKEATAMARKSKLAPKADRRNR